MRRLLSAKWIALHVLVLALAAGMVLLSRWQYGWGEAHNSLQNYSYAAEWLLFAGFTVIAYAKLARDEVRGYSPKQEPLPAGLRVVPRPVATPVSDEEDPELAAYNRYLAELHERSGR